MTNVYANLIKRCDAKLMHLLKNTESFAKPGVGMMDTGSKVSRQVHKPQTVSTPCQAPAYDTAAQIISS